METSAQEKINFHFDILPRKTRKAFDFFSRQPWLKKSRWYLAGGTALALSEGHRQSQDLDFFLPAKDFDVNALLKKMPKGDWVTDIARESTVYGRFSDAKVSFIAYPFFRPEKYFSYHGSIRILLPHDIAVMKIVAISQRGRKRDFVDLYRYVQKYETLAEVIKRLPDQYPTVAHDYHHILKSLTYFDDAENDPMPKLFFKANWKSIKLFFRKETVGLARELLRLE